MGFRERFQRAAAHARVEWRPTAIGASLGLPKQTVARWMDEQKPGEPSGANIFLIADRWKVDPRWLATNDGAMLPRVVMESGAQYRAVTEASLEIAREIDRLSAVCQERVRRQIELLRGTEANHSGRRRAVQHDVEIKKGALRPAVRSKTRKAVR